MCSSPLFYLRPKYSGGNEDSGDLPQKVPMHTLLHSVPPTLLQATTDPRLYQRLLDTPGQVWVSLLWGHCSFLLGPGELKVLFEPSECLWWAWGLILNVILPLLPSWGLSFALGCGVFLKVAPAPCSHCSSGMNENHNHRKLANLITWTAALSNSMKL